LKRFASPDFQVFPASFPSEAKKPVFYYTRYLRVKYERLAHIAEWKADTASSSERTVYFHHRYQRGQPASARELKIKGLMVVSPMKHLCPGAGVEAAGVAMQGNHEIPTWILKWIDNPHLKRFLGRLRLYQGILARKGRRFHGWPIAYFESVQIACS
jgi:hypothetical protein